MRFPACSPPSRPPLTATCPCGVYDPAQARIEAESVKAIHEKYQAQRGPGLPHPRDPASRSSGPSWSSTTCGCCGPTTSSPRTSRSTRSCTSCSTRPPSWPAPAGGKGSIDPADGRRAARQDRRDRRDLLGDQEGVAPPATCQPGQPPGAPPRLTGRAHHTGAPFTACWVDGPAGAHVRGPAGSGRAQRRGPRTSGRSTTCTGTS